MKLSLKELSTLTLNPDTLRLAVQKVQMDGFVLFESVIPRDRIRIIWERTEIYVLLHRLPYFVH